LKQLSAIVSTRVKTLFDRLAPPREGLAGADMDGALGVSRVEAFGSLLQGIGVIAGLTHLSFCALFFWAGAEMLAYVNIGSVLTYVCVFLWARQGQIGRAWISTVLEVLGHAVLAVTVIGWDSGFHYYILLVIPVAVVSSVRPMALRGIIVLLAMVSYLVMDVMLRHHVPPYVLPALVIDGLHYFNVLGVMVILLFLASYYYHLINNAEATLRAMASTDPLTQLLNRRAMGEAVQRESSRASRGDHPLSFLMCDLDHFKAINDRSGHEAGDDVLRAVSQVLAQGVRECDYVARWGGEEFLAALPDTDIEHARMAAERLRATVEALRIENNGERLTIQVTIGVSTMLAGESAMQAISRADDALYEGKRVGRNRVVVASVSSVLKPGR
jgi:diguanylate cyclase (GGDEF)-like protein